MNRTILNENNVVLNVAKETKREAIARVGRLLVQNGYVGEKYIEGMQKREESLSTYVGNGVAIPHGMPEYMRYIRKSGLVVFQYPEGIDFGDGNRAYLLIGIAGKDDEHIEILAGIALVCQEEENVLKLRQAASKEEIIEILTDGEQDD
ncbi:Phosphoenolpyruvate-dependent sugar phosphotransferase system, EIIA 2 [Acididesulfobacillus acetoxydans]|uniref:Mannitol-specific phosphotransferase enzyme IIA component n=1 Tax=Acididesulfobacillus acetoxydans TaxID=1561005 RepID=A0A8S0W2N9_9FIRM|nr:PTS sugar transporter subunit IIA [Acididesulfobacillus acetoxydans]CAA7600116.1 Phosphoenolpyruvate-dependent sugar phosphotransferase system, EIIA 2 [Acididesulfobacillus acetoxydans]CAA7600838.1 Phosphoenolpyruvate-dependent sugar phosphotransferase system, EIIA 2 [Acididesulfobacillus acetoxydans]CEJ07640.1 Mannitol-specific phosphotransferase enzyme IIA component [Acididesulfobacillus acetoxydans]